MIMTMILKKMDDTDEGLTYKQFEQYKTLSDQLKTESKMKSENNETKVEIEDLGPDMEEDIKTQDQSSKDADTNSNNSPEEDDGSWILDIIDLSGLKNWPEHLQKEAKEMLKRNAKVFSKTDMDMGRTNLVKSHYQINRSCPF